VCWWFGATKPPAHPADGNEVCSRYVGKSSHPNAAVCLRKISLNIMHCLVLYFSSASNFYQKNKVIIFCTLKFETIDINAVMPQVKYDVHQKYAYATQNCSRALRIDQC